MRLTNADRDSVTNRAVTHAIDAARKQLDDEENRLAMLCYHRVFPEKVLKSAKALPEEWLRLDSCLRFQIGFRAVQLRSNPAVVVPSRQYNCQRLGIVDDDKVGTAYDNLQAQKDALKETEARIRANVKALLYRCSTLKRLRETWPEGEQFYKHLTPRDEAEVPMVIVDDINKMLGLPVSS